MKSSTHARLVIIHATPEMLEGNAIRALNIKKTIYN